MEEHGLAHGLLYTAPKASLPPSYCGLMACMGLSGAEGCRESGDDHGPAALYKDAQASNLSAVWTAAHATEPSAGRRSLQLPPSTTGPQRHAALLVGQVPSPPAQQGGVTGWLEGWKRLAKQQGCAVEEVAPAAVSRQCTPLTHSELYLQDHVRVQQYAAHAGLYAAHAQLPGGSCNQTFAAPLPPQARVQPSVPVTSAFLSSSAPPPLLAQIQQQAVGQLAAGRSQESSPLRSRGRCVNGWPVGRLQWASGTCWVLPSRKQHVM